MGVPARRVGVPIAGPADFQDWRGKARRLLAAGVPPEAVEWRVAGEAPGLFAEAEVPDAVATAPKPPSATATPSASPCCTGSCGGWPTGSRP